MKNRFLKWVAVIGAMSLVSGALMISANAHIGASHSPFTTEGPDLRSVTLVGDDDEALFCFDEEVALITAGSDDDFDLAGFDSLNRISSVDADLATSGDIPSGFDAEAEQCVLAEYTTTRDLDLFTVGIVETGVVEDRDNNDNVEASAALDGGDDGDGDGDGEADGETDAPNLESFEDDEGDDTITYIFDEDVDCADLTDADTDDANQFGYYQEDGDAEYGDDIESCDDNEVTVEFAGAGVEDAARAFVDPDPMANSENEDSEVCAEGAGDNCTSHDAAGGDTDRPDLVRVERTDDETFLFTFDEDIDTVSAANFFLFESDDTRYEADDCDEEGDDAVECDFDNVEDVEDDLVMGAVDECAVQDDDATNDCNTIGDQPIEDTRPDAGDDTDGGTGSGSTDAPDLEECEINGDVVTFRFDETVDDDFEPNEADLDVFDEDGNMRSADEDVDVEGNEITATFDDDALADAVGCHVDGDGTAGNSAVRDEAGNWNLEASVGVGEVDGSPTGGTTTTTTTTTATTTTTTTSDTTTDREPRTIRADSTITIRYDARPRRRAAFKGSVANRFDRCVVGRQVHLHKRGDGNPNPVGRDDTNSRGNWKIRKRRARGRFFAEVLRKRYTRRNGDTVICRPDESVTINVARRRRR